MSRHVRARPRDSGRADDVTRPVAGQGAEPSNATRTFLINETVHSGMDLLFHRTREIIIQSQQ